MPPVAALSPQVLPGLPGSNPEADCATENNTLSGQHVFCLPFTALCIINSLKDNLLCSAPAAV